MRISPEPDASGIRVSVKEHQPLKARRALILLFLLVSVFYFHEGVAMSLFFGGEKVEAVLFSPLEGKLTFNGKPAAGAKIDLWIKWKNTEGEHFDFTADENGFFHIPQKVASYKESALAQIVITQEITVEYSNESYLIWTLSKTSTHQFGELGGKASNLTCELTNDLEAIRTDDILMGTSCSWDSISKQ
jgi:hypothetical protein